MLIIDKVIDCILDNMIRNHVPDDGLIEKVAEEVHGVLHLPDRFKFVLCTLCLDEGVKPDNVAVSHEQARRKEPAEEDANLQAYPSNIKVAFSLRVPIGLRL